MATIQSVQATLLGIVALIKTEQLKAAKVTLDSLERALNAPSIGACGESFEPERSLEVSNILFCAAEALSSGDAPGALIWLEQALTAWVRVREQLSVQHSK